MQSFWFYDEDQPPARTEKPLNSQAQLTFAHGVTWQQYWKPRPENLIARIVHKGAEASTFCLIYRERSCLSI